MVNFRRRGQKSDIYYEHNTHYRGSSEVIPYGKKNYLKKAKYWRKKYYGYKD